jgi:murein DD-endopeptidase MepM/ murein hydrolase activator NlpD
VLTYPLALRATEVSPFGWRYSESRLAWRIHAGTDLIVPEGTAVRAALPGKVRLVQEVSGYGLTVVIDHGRGWQTLYAHLLDLAVGPFQEVAAGDPIGRVGSSGEATAPHLHFELRRHQGASTVAIDAGPLLEFSGSPLVARELEQAGHPAAHR